MLPLLLSFALFSCAIPEAPDRVALVYGVSVYDADLSEGSGPNLTLADNDAEDVAALLTVQGWDVRLRTDAAATSVAILQDIADLEATGFDGLVLVYYSGHGGLFGGESVICPKDSYNGVANQWVTDNFMTAQELFDPLKDAGLDHVIVLLDSCNSGGFVEAGATADAIPSLFGPLEEPDGSELYGWYVNALGAAVGAYHASATYDNVIVLSAGGTDDVVWESGVHGIFTGFLLEAPREGDYDKDGYVTTAELYRYTSTQIELHWNTVYWDYYDQAAEQYADYHPHTSGSPREYVVFEAD